MERQPYPPPGSCVAKNSHRPASVETVQGGVPPYGVKETLVVNGKYQELSSFGHTIRNKDNVGTSLLLEGHETPRGREYCTCD